MRSLATIASCLIALIVVHAHAAVSQAPLSPDAMSEKVMGSDDAKIIIIEYASLTCPHCAKFHNEIFPQLKAEYIDTGKAKLIYRDFPLEQFALKASLLARCAPSRQFFAFIDVLYSQQANWSKSEDPVASLTKLGRLGGLSKKKFEACAANEDLINFVVQQRLSGEKEYSVTGTPTFIVNGKKLTGVQTFAQFKAVLDPLLE